LNAAVILSDSEGTKTNNYMWLNILVFVITFLAMEFVAWSTHKFVMHGFLWHLHEDHHLKTNDTFFEKNDSFFLIFSIPSFLCFLFGALMPNSILVSIGCSIAAYGACYFLVHDIFIHQRFKWLRNSNNRYLRAVRRAHKIHHKYLGKEHGESFGMLFFPLKYWLESGDKKSLM
jgi:beta-carotene 3-hydroxylase